MLRIFKAAACLALATGAAHGQQASPNLATMPEDERIEFLEDLAIAATPPKYVSVLGIPSGTAMSGGTAFLALGGTTRDFEGTGLDGSLSLGFGLPTGTSGFAAHVVANITSVSQDTFGDSGSFAVKASAPISTGRQTVSIGAGASRLGGWGEAAGLDPSYTVAATVLDHWFSGAGEPFPVLMTIGANSTASELGDWGGFAGVGVGFTRYFGASIAYDAQAAVFGVGATLPGVEGLSLTGSYRTTFENTGEDRATFGLSYVFNGRK